MAKSRYGVVARLVWDSGKDVVVPEEMGAPRKDQLQGSAGERLSELAGRVCYDSCGTGRSSADFHKHILDVGHLSVYEHPQMTIRIPYSFHDVKESDILWACANRPGLWVESEGVHIRLTFNPRVVLDWDKWNFGYPSKEKTQLVGKFLRYHAEQAWPHITPCPAHLESKLLILVSGYSSVCEPYHPEEKWISMYLSGSRGFSHECVRHGDRTAISQRSSRFCAENESPWIDHPLEQEYARETGDTALTEMGALVKSNAQGYYGEAVKRLEAWLIKRGVDKLSARKQARGAARGKLGNALETQLIFSASVAQWKRMIRMRAHPAADAEIRAVFIEVILNELKKSRYREDFEGFEIIPAPDGIGECVKETR